MPFPAISLHPLCSLPFTGKSPSSRLTGNSFRGQEEQDLVRGMQNQHRRGGSGVRVLCAGQAFPIAQVHQTIAFRPVAGIYSAYLSRGSSPVTAILTLSTLYQLFLSFNPHVSHDRKRRRRVYVLKYSRILCVHLHIQDVFARISFNGDLIETKALILI